MFFSFAKKINWGKLKWDFSLKEFNAPLAIMGSDLTKLYLPMTRN